MQTLLVLCLCLLAGDKSSEQVESAARRFRIRTYQQFRTHREEFDRRRDLAKEAIEQWNSAQQTAESAQELVDWLQALETSAAGEIPPVPAFDTEPQPASPLEIAAPERANGRTANAFLNPFDRNGDKGHNLVGRFSRALMRGVLNSATADQ